MEKFIDIDEVSLYCSAGMKLNIFSRKGWIFPEEVALSLYSKYRKVTL